MEFAGQQFWIALAQVISVNLVLSVDNAMVIALVVRCLPHAQLRQAMLFGTVAIIALRLVLTLTVTGLLTFPWLKLAGGILLLWTGIKQLSPQEAAPWRETAVATRVMAAIRAILLADLVMSFDNTIAVAASAKNNFAALVLGLAISIPVIIGASRLILRLMDRFPVIITLGGALVGYLAGELAVGDRAIAIRISDHAPWLRYAIPVMGAVLVAVVGKFLAAGKLSKPR